MPVLSELAHLFCPISSGQSERQLMFMKDFGTTALIATPSYILHLTEVMQAQGVKREDLKLRVGLFGGEGHTPEMRRLIMERLEIVDTQNYGLTEICRSWCFIRMSRTQRKCISTKIISILKSLIPLAVKYCLRVLKESSS